MKILQVIPYFAPAWGYGGPVTVCFEICKELVHRGHQVVVYTTDSLGKSLRINQKVKQTTLEGIEVHYFKNINNLLAFKHHFFVSPGLIIEAKNIRNFDIIHLMEYRTYQNVIIRNYANRYHVPYILQGHGSIPRRMGKQGLKRLYDYLWGYDLLRDASKLIAITSTEVGQYQKMGVDNSKIQLLPNGVNLDEFNNLPPKGKFRNKLSLNEDISIILFLGRINAIKGLDLLVKAYSKVLYQLPNTRLAIVGPDDGYLPQLRRLISDMGINNNIIITGPLYAEHKLEAYIDADLYVLPSFSEGFPITVLEACACGTPVLITDECGITDIIKGQAGLTVSADENQIANSIVSLLNDKQARKRMGEKGKKLVQDKFNWKIIVGQLEELYKSCSRLSLR